MLFRNAHGAGLHAHLNRAPQLFPPFGGNDDDEEAAPTTTRPPANTNTQTQVNNQPTTTRQPTRPTTPPVVEQPNTPTTTRAPNTPTTPAANPNANTQTRPTTQASVSQQSVNTPINNNNGVTVTPPVNSITYDAGGDSYIPGQQTIKSASTPTNTSAADDSDGGGSMVKVGYAAGALLGFGLIVAGIFFLMKRNRNKRENEALGDVFDRNSFVRDSMTIPDHGADDSNPSERGRPRPPTMIARHIGATNANTPFGEFGGGGYGAPPVPPMPGNAGYYGQNGQNGGYSDYDQYSSAHGGNYGYDNYNYGGPQPGFGSYQDSPMHSPMDPYADPNQSANYLNHQVGGPEYPVLAAPAPIASPTTENGRSLTRQPSNGAPGVDYPNIAELGRGTSVTPFQAAQYAEIGKRLDDPVNPNDPTGAYARLDRPHGQQHPGQPRPNSVYKEDDAYGGI